MSVYIYIIFLPRSAILNAGYKVSLSHTAKNSHKTDAPIDVIWVNKTHFHCRMVIAGDIPKLSCLDFSSFIY